MYLPCCALGADSEYKKMEEAKPSFKRVFEESDEEENEPKEAPKVRNLNIFNIWIRFN